jgi:hypothetical protein
MDNSSNLNGFQTPPCNIKTEDKLERMTWAPKREGNSNKVIIPFPMMYQKNIFSTPVKWIVDNPYTPGAPMKRLTERKFTQRDLKPVKKRLFENKKNFSPYSRIL